MYPFERIATINIISRVCSRRNPQRNTPKSRPRAEVIATNHVGTAALGCPAERARHRLGRNGGRFRLCIEREPVSEHKIHQRTKDDRNNVRRDIIEP
jgi:hypothetical protein